MYHINRWDGETKMVADIHIFWIQAAQESHWLHFLNKTVATNVQSIFYTKVAPVTSKLSRLHWNSWQNGGTAL